MVDEAGLVRDFAVIMVVAGVALVLFRRLRLPPILGYLGAGLLVGPHTPPRALVEDERTIRLLADLGLVLLLFAVGVALTVRMALPLHGVIATTFARTFLGHPGRAAPEQEADIQPPSEAPRRTSPPPPG